MAHKEDELTPIVDQKSPLVRHKPMRNRSHAKTGAFHEFDIAAFFLIILELGVGDLAHLHHQREQIA